MVAQEKVCAQRNFKSEFGNGGLLQKFLKVQVKVFPE